MIDTILVALGALMIATFAGVLLAPADAAARRIVLSRQSPTRQKSPIAPHRDFHAT